MNKNILIIKSNENRKKGVKLNMNKMNNKLKLQKMFSKNKKMKKKKSIVKIQNMKNKIIRQKNNK